MKPVGQGTERIEEALTALFPGVTLARLDRDVVRRRGDMEEVVRRMSSGQARILVGTQMVTKGHDFPNVTLVVVLNADQGLFSSDFRAPERLAQTIVQVAGRAGRGSRPGEVLIQTEFPSHPLLLSLLAAGYDGFAHTALAERAQASWPPFSRLAAVRDSAKTAEAALEFLTDARKLTRDASRGVRLLGPVPAAMAKRAGRYHAQLLLESADRADVRVVARAQPLGDVAGRLAELRQVLADAEASPGPRDDDRANLRVACVLERTGHRLVHRRVERIQDVGAVERDREDRAFAAHFDLGHAQTFADRRNGAAGGAVVRTCGLCPCVRLNRPVDAIRVVTRRRTRPSRC